MNDTFSFKRLLLLIQKHWYENRKLHLLGILAVTGLLIVFYLYRIVADKHNYPLDTGGQFMYCFIGLGIVFMLYSLFYFHQLNQKQKATHYLLLPASHLEKMACAVFYCTILTTIVWFCIHYVVNTSMVALLNKLAEHNKKEYENMFEHQRFIPRPTVNIFTYREMFRPALCICLSLQAIALLGSFFFEKHTFIKTTVTILTVWLFLFLLQEVLLKSLMPTKFFLYETGVYKTESYTMEDTGRYAYHPAKYIFLSPGMTAFMRTCIYYVPWPLLTIATFFRLKEKAI